MAKPAVPHVTLELWRDVLDRVAQYRQAAPWRWVPDYAISAYVDRGRQPWFACILGGAGQIFGLCLYRGATGLRFHRLVQESEGELEPAEHLHTQDAVTVWFGPKAGLDPVQRKIYGELGFAPTKGARNAWPEIRSHRPGFFPWHPEEEELRVLRDAIPGVLRFADFYRQHPDCYEQRGEWDIPSVPTNGAANSGEAIEWRTWLTPPEPEIPPPVLLDLNAASIQQARALPQSDDVLEVDWFYAPEVVAEEGRPFYPRFLAVLRGYGGFCYAMELLKPSDDAAVVAAAMIVDATEQLRARPAKIHSTKPELAFRLAPLATALGAESNKVRQLPAFAEFRRELEKRALGHR